MPNLDPKRGRELLIDCGGGANLRHDVVAGAVTLGAAFTAMIWAKVASTASVAAGTLYGSKAGGVGGNEWQISVLSSAGALRFEAGAADATSDTDGLILADDVWHFIAGVFDAGEAADDDKGRIYLDGALVATTSVGTWPASLAAASADFGIGADSAAASPTNITARSAALVRAALTPTQLQVAQSLLQGRDHSHFQRYMASIGAPIEHHVQPSFVGRYSDPSSFVTACRDLSPNARLAVPSLVPAPSLLPKDKAHLVAGAT